jgi:hypothetical protein
MVGGFILVALLFCVLLAWPGRRRWPLWMIGGLCLSLCLALTASVTPGSDPLTRALQVGAVAAAGFFVAAATIRDLRDTAR